MKLLFYFVMALISLVCAICAFIVLFNVIMDPIQFVGIIFLIMFSLASTMIFGFNFIYLYQENKAYDRAAREQADTDYEFSIY
jgi:hypothetical protein